MVTFGGIILSEDQTVENLPLSDFDFINPKKLYNIEVPNLTLREIIKVNQNISNINELKKLSDKSIIKKKDIEAYEKIYKYMPNYLDVRM